MKFFKTVKKFLNPFTKKYSAKRLSKMMVLGFLLGMSPILSPVGLLLVIIFFLRGSRFSTFVLGYAIAFGLKYPIVMISHEIGRYVLQLPQLLEAYTFIYNTSWGQLSGFNNTVVMGNLSIGLCLSLLFLFLFEKLILGVRKDIKKSPDDKSKEEESFDDDPKEDKSNRRLGVFIVLALLGMGYGGFKYLLPRYTLYFLEEKLTESWGSEVSVEEFKFSINPLGISVYNIQFSDTEDLNKNKFQIQDIHFHVSLFHLIMGRFVIEDLAFSDILLDEPREFPAKVLKKNVEDSIIENKDQEQSYMSFLNQNLSTPEEMLEKNPLKFVDASKKLSSEYDDMKKEWDQIKKSLPGQKRIKYYEKSFNDFKKLIKGASISELPKILSKQKKYKKILKQVSSDFTSMQRAKKFLDDRLPQVKSAQNQIKHMAKRDYQRLSQRYDTAAVEQSLDIMSVILANSYKGDIDNLKNYYLMLKPYMEDSDEDESFKGELVLFHENDPQPFFNIKKVQASGRLGEAKYNLVGNNINVSNVPGGFTMVYQPDDQDVPLNVGYKKVLEGKKIVDMLRVVCQGYQLSDRIVIDNKDLQVKMEKGQIFLETDFKVVDGKLEGVMMANFSHVKFQTLESKGVKNNIVSNTLGRVNSFYILLELSGDILKPDISIKTDLNERLSFAIKALFKKRIERVKQDLEKQLEEKLAKQLGPIGAKTDEFSQLQKRLMNDEKIMRSIIDFDAENVINKLKNDNRSVKDILKEFKGADDLKKAIKGFGF